MAERGAKAGWISVIRLVNAAADWSERHPRRAWLLALFLVLAVVTVEALRWPLADFPGAMWHHPNRGIDVEAVQAGAARAGWRELLGFWHGPYIDGNPTFRPLSAWWFTAQYHLFGRADRLWCWVSIVLHLGIAMLMTWAVAVWMEGRVLARLATGAGAAVLFGGPGMADRSVQQWALCWWPAQPDLLSLIWALLLLSWVVLHVRSGERRWAAAALAAFAIGLCFKEMMYVAGLGACLLLVRHRDRWPLLGGLAVVGMGSFLYRSWIYRHAESHARDDAARLGRMVAADWGGRMADLGAALPHLVFLGLGACAGWAVGRRRGRLLGWVTAGGLYLVLAMALLGLPTEPYFQSGLLVVGQLAGALALLWGFLRAARRWPVPELAVLTLGCVLIGLSFPPILAWHRYWATAFQSSLLAIALAALVGLSADCAATRAGGARA